MLNIQEIEIALSPVLIKKAEACKVHSLFNYKYIVGIGISNKLHVFQEELNKYQYKTCISLPNEIPEGTKAAFLIDDFADCSCIITPSCLKEPNFFATILHEFVHCYQNRTCEQDLKEKLEIYQHAFKNRDYMWEINHSFPYTNSDYVKLVQNVSRFDYHEIMISLSNLKSTLERYHYEYMIWQIWKEGFARFIENKILRMNSIPENNTGINYESPNRTSLYFVGDRIWRQFEIYDTSLIENIDKVFCIIKGNLSLTTA